MSRFFNFASLTSIGVGITLFNRNYSRYQQPMMLDQLNAKEQVRIAVIGGGLAGLTTARLLGKQGFTQITLFEATDHIGGRVRTLRQENGLYAEAGALSICDTEKTILNLATELGLELVPRTDRSQKRYFEQGGWSDNKILSTPLVTYVMNEIAKLNIQNPDDWFDKKHSELDRLSLREFLQLRTQHLDYQSQQTVITHIQSSLIGLCCDDLNNISALDTCRFMNQYASVKLVYSIAGGNDKLPSALANSLPHGVLNLQSPVKQVTQFDQTVKLTIDYKSGRAIEEFDYVVIAVPLSMLNSNNQQAIKFTPALPTQTQIQSIPYNQSVSRIYFELSERFWLDKNPTGMVITGNPTFWIEDHTAHLNKSGAILEAHASGPVGHKLKNALNPVKVAENLIYEIYPQMKHADKKTRGIIIWDESMPYQAGAYPYFGPGQLHYINELKKPFGRLFFAGEYTSIMCPASMNGAIESAYQVVNDLNNKISQESTDRNQQNAHTVDEHKNKLGN